MLEEKIAMSHGEIDRLRVVQSLVEKRLRQQRLPLDH
jgi:hypothetical protein